MQMRQVGSKHGGGSHGLVGHGSWGTPQEANQLQFRSESGVPCKAMHHGTVSKAAQSNGASLPARREDHMCVWHRMAVLTRHWPGLLLSA